MKNYFYVLFLSFSCSFSQYDSITVLEEVLIDTKLNVFSTGQTLLKLSDSVAKQNPPLLSSLLNFNTPVYFKENGSGMVSSPSFRGTTASQTAVLWNGININSQFNGQIDFNTINASGFDDITVRGGGGSVVYGTGAIGGTIHLNTHLSFKEKIENLLFLQTGSFNTHDLRYRFKTARGDWSLLVSGARNSSDNDYKLPNDRGENSNGEFYNNTLNIGVAYRFSRQNTLKFYSELFEGARHFSLIRPSETKTKYKNLNSRNLLEWENKFSNFTSLAKVAFLDEHYKYFDNIASADYSFGDAETLIAQYDFEASLSQNLQLNMVLTNTHTNGKGSSLEKNSRNIFSGAFLMKHRLNEKLSYEAGFRKESTANYESPFLFSAGANYLFSDFYSLKFDASRNFRIPTFNDLYWTSSGNTALKPETSIQAEVGNRFTWRALEVNLTAYYIDINDMIRWLPGSNGEWRPQNEDEVHTYGLESFLSWKKQVGRVGFFGWRGSYAYTISENKKTGNQLIYVPYHKATTAISYSLERWKADYQILYTGEIFTRSDNDPRYNLQDYIVSNVGISYGIGEKKGDYRLGARALNLFNKAYESVENRWMPGINFNIFLNLNF